MRKPDIKVYIRNRIVQDDEFLEPQNKYIKYVEVVLLSFICIGIIFETSNYALGIFLWLMYFYFSKLYLEFKN